MSVPKWKRKVGQLPVLDKATQLMRHTMGKTKNEKYFPKSTRWQYTYDLSRAVMDVYMEIRRANIINVKSHEDYVERNTHQIMAREALEVFIGLLQVHYELKPLPDDEMDYWMELAMDCDEDLKKWMWSERKKYKEFL